MAYLYLKWQGGSRKVVNDIFALAIEEGFSIMNNNDLDIAIGKSNKQDRLLLPDEIECGIKASGLYYLISGVGFAINNLQVIETKIRQLLTDAKAEKIHTETLRPL